MNIRRQAIVDMVNHLGSVTLAQLKTSFPEVSEVTLRTDLRHLDEMQQLIRTHGGAKSLLSVTGSKNNFSVRTNLHQPEKALIASKAASLIHPNDTVFISAGTTCAELSKQLPAYPLYLFTDGIGTLLEIPKNPDYSIELFGGSYDPHTMRITGPSVAQEIQNLRFSISFIGTPGFHPKYGFSCLTAFHAQTINAVIGHSEKVVMLMDSSKVNYSSSSRLIPLNKVDIVVSDGKLDRSIVSSLEAKGILVL